MFPGISMGAEEVPGGDERLLSPPGGLGFGSQYPRLAAHSCLCGSPSKGSDTSSGFLRYLRTGVQIHTRK